MEYTPPSAFDEKIASFSLSNAFLFNCFNSSLSSGSGFSAQQVATCFQKTLNGFEAYRGFYNKHLQEFDVPESIIGKFGDEDEEEEEEEQDDE